MRRFLLVFVLITGFWPDSLSAQESTKTMVCSTTQVADFARNIVGDRWKVKCVLAAGEDPHKYKTTITDVNMVKTADLCVRNGWGLEGNEWMETLAKTANKKLVTCVDGVKALQADEGDGATVKDPHAWMAPKNAVIYVKNILKAVSKIDPDNADEYKARAALYVFQLQALDSWAKQQINQVPANRRVLVTHHDAFSYFCKSYGFVAKSPGQWSTADLAGISTSRRKEVTEAIRSLGVKAIFVETTLQQDVMKEIAKEAGVKIGGELYSDSMGPEDSAGESYIGMMRENILTIVKGLR